MNARQLIGMAGSRLDVRYGRLVDDQRMSALGAQGPKIYFVDAVPLLMQTIGSHRQAHTSYAYKRRIGERLQ